MPPLVQHGQVYRGFEMTGEVDCSWYLRRFVLVIGRQGGVVVIRALRTTQGRVVGVIMSQALGALCRDLREDGK